MKKGSSLPARENRSRVSGQSIVEAVVVLALVAILVIALLRGVGQQTASRLQHANEALDEAAWSGLPGGAGTGAPSGQTGGAGSGASTPEDPSGTSSGGGGLTPVGSGGQAGQVEPPR